MVLLAEIFSRCMVIRAHNSHLQMSLWSNSLQCTIPETPALPYVDFLFRTFFHPTLSDTTTLITT